MLLTGGWGDDEVDDDDDDDDDAEFEVLEDDEDNAEADAPTDAVEGDFDVKMSWAQSSKGESLMILSTLSASVASSFWITFTRALFSLSVR